MELSVIIAKLAEGMFVSIQIFIMTLVFSLPLGLVVAFGRMSKSHSEECSKGLYFHYARNTADAAADDGIFRAVLFVSN